MLEIVMKTDQIAKLKITPKTGAGRPAPVDGAPVWEIVSGGGSVVAGPDGLTAQFISVDEVTDPSGEEVTIGKVTADADLGAGVVTIEDTFRATVTNARAEALGLVTVELIAKP